MGLMLLGLALFLGVHSIAIVAPGARERLVRRLGAGPWKGLYALVSIAGFYLIVVGFGAARAAPVVLYTPPMLLRYVAVVLLLPVFPMAFSAYFPGRIQRALKDPLLLATKTWAFAHLLANGTLADVILFGALLAWAVADRISLRHRTPNAIATAPPGRFNDALAIVLGLALYAAFLAGAHRWLIGVAPLG